LKIKTGGRDIPQDVIYYFKSRSQHGPHDTAKLNAQAMSQLWISRVFNHITAWHSGGIFSSKTPYNDMRKEIDRWEKAQQRELITFARWLQEILILARGHGRLQICRSAYNERNTTVRKIPGHIDLTLPFWLACRWHEETSSVGNGNDSALSALAAQVEHFDMWWTACRKVGRSMSQTWNPPYLF
jgi:hypothetical protein